MGCTRLLKTVESNEAAIPNIIASAIKYPMIVISPDIADINTVSFVIIFVLVPFFLKRSETRAKGITFSDFMMMVGIVQTADPDKISARPPPIEAAHIA